MLQHSLGGDGTASAEHALKDYNPGQESTFEIIPQLFLSPSFGSY